jgi:hypothetical protein
MVTATGELEVSDVKPLFVSFRTLWMCFLPKLGVLMFISQDRRPKSLDHLRVDPGCSVSQAPVGCLGRSCWCNNYKRRATNIIECCVSETYRMSLAKEFFEKSIGLLSIIKRTFGEHDRF